MPNTYRQHPFRQASTAPSSFALDLTEQILFTTQISPEELSISDEALGSGTFGTVFRGRWRGQRVAVKQFKTQEEIDSFLVEVKQLSCVKHPNIVTLFGASAQRNSAYLVMECSDQGSLNFLLHESKHQDYDLRHACSWAMQTARGVAYLHEMRPKPIMHRDLKPANLLLFDRGKVLKICDFGTACTVKTKMTNNTGSASYMAPEVFATSNYHESGDVFSWSIIYWEILARRHPYSQQYSNPYQILWRVKQEGTRPNAIEDCPEIIWDLITRGWNKDPSLRPTMRQVATEMEVILNIADPRSHYNTQVARSLQRASPDLLPSCSYVHDMGQSLLSMLRAITLRGPSTQQTKNPIQLSSVQVHGRPLLAEVRELQARIRDYMFRLQLIDRRVERLRRAEEKGEKISMWDSIEEFRKVARLVKYKQALVRRRKPKS